MDAVELSAEGYDALAEKAALAESLELIDRSVAELKRGEGKPLKRAAREIAEELGLELVAEPDELPPDL